jgi:hypothetical protein
VVHPDSTRVSRVPAYSRNQNIRSASFSRTRLSRPLASHSNYSANHADFLPYWQLTGRHHKKQRSMNRALFPGHLKSHNPCISIRLSTYLPCLYYPKAINYQAKTYKVCALPISLATTLGIICYFLFLALLRCFSSGGSLSITLYIQVTVSRHDS